MKKNTMVVACVFTFLGFLPGFSQIKLDQNLLGAAQKAVAGFTFTNEQAAQLSAQAVAKMDIEHVIASPTNAYAVRLNKICGKYKQSNGLNLNYKVYILKEVNAFATADGSIRVYSGLMDIMDDNELLVVIAHEMGHVHNNDSRDAIKAAYRKEALIAGAASQSDKIAELSNSQLGEIASAMIDSKHSRKQEAEADTFAYDFMKKNGYDVNAVESAFSILSKTSQGAQTNFLTKMLSSHPDPQMRADIAKERAKQEGLYKPYIQKKPVVVAPKKVVKKTVSKKK